MIEHPADHIDRGRFQLGREVVEALQGDLLTWVPLQAGQQMPLQVSTKCFYNENSYFMTHISLL